MRPFYRSRSGSPWESERPRVAYTDTCDSTYKFKNAIRSTV
jgi:hypothetical protein